LDKLKIPNTPLLLSDGQVSPHWLRLFENIIKELRVSSVIEIGTGDEEENGNWRIKQSGDDLITQKKVSDTWTTKDTVAG